MENKAVKICETMLVEYYATNDNLEKKRRFNYLYAFIYAKVNTLSIDEKLQFINFLMQDKNTKKIYEDLINSEHKNLATTNNDITIRMSKHDYDTLLKLFSKLKGVQ